MSITTGTKIDEIRSASRCTGALEPWAVSSNRTISDSFVLAPTSVTSTVSRPCPLIDAPTTSLPGATSTGTDSPVSIDRSTHDSTALGRPRRPGSSPPAERPRGRLAAAPRSGRAARRPPSQDRRAPSRLVRAAPRRVAGGRAGARLERLADQDQRDDHRGGVEVVALAPFSPRSRSSASVHVSRSGAQRHQRVHRGGPVRGPRARRIRKNGQPGPEHDGCRQRPARATSPSGHRRHAKRQDEHRRWSTATATTSRRQVRASPLLRVPVASCGRAPYPTLRTARINGSSRRAWCPARSRSGSPG